MKKLLLLLLISTFAFGQNPTRNIAGFGAGFSTNDLPASSIFEARSTTKGVLFPRLTTTQRDAIVSPAESLLIFNTTTGGYQYYHLGVWTDFAGGSTPTLQQVYLVGNEITDGVDTLTVTPQGFVSLGGTVGFWSLNGAGLQLSLFGGNASVFAGGMTLQTIGLGNAFIESDQLGVNDEHFKLPNKGGAGGILALTTDIVTQTLQTVTNGVGNNETTNSIIIRQSATRWIEIGNDGSYKQWDTDINAFSPIGSFGDGYFTINTEPTAGDYGMAFDPYIGLSLDGQNAVINVNGLPFYFNVLGLGGQLAMLDGDDLTPNSVVSTGDIKGTTITIATNGVDKTVTIDHPDGTVPITQHIQNIDGGIFLYQQNVESTVINGSANPPSSNAVYNAIASATGVTNLNYTPSATNGTVTSDTGTDATLPLADSTNSGLLKPADFDKFSHLTIAGAVLNIDGNSATASSLNNRIIGTITGDATSAGSTFNGTANNTNALTLATVNSNVGSFTNASVTVNAKGLVTAVSSGTAPVTSVTGTANRITVTGTTTPTLDIGTDVVTLTGTQTVTNKSLTSPTLTGLTTVTGTTQTGSSAIGVFDITQTLNTTGSPTIIKSNVTNTASGSTTKLIDLQVGAVTQFNVTKAGLGYFAGGLSLPSFSAITGANGNSITFGSNALTYTTGTSTTATGIGHSFAQGNLNNITSGNYNFIQAAQSFTPTSGTGTFSTLVLSSTINQTGGANGITRGIYINPTITAAADYRALDITSGKIFLASTNTATGTTGAQTINKMSGTVNFAMATSTLVVTNNLVTASSIVFAVVRTNDSTADIKNVVPVAGSFTITLSSATTAETSVGFFVIN